jgi:hypothetical protein
VKKNSTNSYALKPKVSYRDGPERSGPSEAKSDRNAERCANDGASQGIEMYHDDNMVTSERSGDRRLWAAEEERLCGLPEGASNFIEKVPEESRECRQLRRHSLIASTLNVRVLLFLLETVLVNSASVLQVSPLPFGIDELISSEVLGASPFMRDRLKAGEVRRYLGPDDCEMDSQMYGFLAEGMQARRMPSRATPLMAVPAG